MSLQTQLQEAERILQSEFGFKPEQTKLIYHDQNSWDKLTKRGNRKATGLFRPRTLTAHIKNTLTPPLLPRVIHEYLGHGSYCEHTRNGKIIVKFEQDSKDLETKLAGRKLPNNQNMVVVNAKKTLLMKSPDPDFDYILYINKENPSLQTYLKLLQQYGQFEKENKLTFEGFAVWLEEFLLKRLNQEKLWEEISKLRQEKRDSYQDFYEEFKKFEQEYGTLALVYRVGFPRLFDEKHILNLASEYLDLEDLSLLILYGSQRPYGDIDLVAVSKEEKPQQNIFSEEVDLVVLSEKEFTQRLKSQDIAITEPLLTGTPILGKPKFTELKSKLYSQTFHKEHLEFLKQKAVESFQYAQHHYIKASQSNNPIHYLASLINVSYVWSYLLTSQIYHQNPTPIRLTDLLKLDTPLSEVVQYSKEIKEGKVNPEPSKIKDFLKAIPLN